MANGNARNFDLRNVVFSVLFVGFSLAMGIHAYRNINLGTAVEMGPGYFPLMLSIMLGVLSACVAFLPARPETPAFRLAPLKAIILVLATPVVFALSIRTLGLAMGVAATVFVAFFASRFSDFRQSIIFTVAFTIFCVLVFGYLLNLPIPLLGKWFIG
jgi:hypothetical protein